MAIYKINTSAFECSSLESHKFRSEGSHKISPQEIIASFPEIILSIPELEIPDTVSSMVTREYSTSSGSIDIIIITENADIILIETKLFRNPESQRTVVAQAIDYIKSFSKTELDHLKGNFLRSKYSDSELVDELFKQDQFYSTLRQSIKTGNYKVLIVGDKIHPNILNMVESIQSAPHLAFTLYLVELRPYAYDENNILLYPQIVANTNEIERSVIRLEIDYEKNDYSIESSIPETDRKGSRPILSPDQYLESITKSEFIPIIQKFWDNWKAMGGDIRFGQVGFSCGLIIGKQRIAFQFVYNDRIALISENWRNRYSISDEGYDQYKKNIKDKIPKAYDYLIGNRVTISFDSISESEFENILEATILLAKDEKE